MKRDQQHQQEDETWARQATSPSTDSTPRSIHDQIVVDIEACAVMCIAIALGTWDVYFVA